MNDSVLATKRIEVYRRALSGLWETSRADGLIEGSFPGFSEEDGVSFEKTSAADPELFRVARACRPKRSFTLARGGERVTFFGGNRFDSEAAREEFPELNWPFAPLAIDADGSQAGLARDTADGKIYLCLLEPSDSPRQSERPGWGSSFFILTGRFERLPSAIRYEHLMWSLLHIPVDELCDPSRANPRNPPLDLRAELKDWRYLILLIPGMAEFDVMLRYSHPSNDGNARAQLTPIVLVGIAILSVFLNLERRKLAPQARRRVFYFAWSIAAGGLFLGYFAAIAFLMSSDRA